MDFYFEMSSSFSELIMEEISYVKVVNYYAKQISMLQMIDDDTFFKTSKLKELYFIKIKKYFEKICEQNEDLSCLDVELLKSIF